MLAARPGAVPCSHPVSRAYSSKNVAVSATLALEVR
jgi:hypothetical protein